MKTILSLCDFTGNWAKPYKDAGYRTITIDIKHGHDVRDTASVIRLAGESVHGVLCAPPCTDFSCSGAQYWKAKDKDGRTAESLSIVDACLEIVSHYKAAGSLAWWVLENPVGRLPKLRPALGSPVLYFNPCDFGDPYTKKTGLWGEFNTSLPKTPVEPERVCAQGSWLQKLGGKSERTKSLRSATPLGFAHAFCKANP